MKNSSSFYYAKSFNGEKPKIRASVIPPVWRRWLLLSVMAMTMLFGSAQAQTYFGDLLITQQSEIDNFNYTEVTGYVYITGTGIANLDGLSELTTVGNYFFLFNTNVEHVDGLGNLATTGDFLYFVTNPLLTEIDGLSNFTSANGGVYFDDNDQLTNLDGMIGLTTTATIAVRGNAVISDVSGLGSVTTMNGGLEVTSNPMLSDCCVPYELEDLAAYVSYFGNAPGCNSSSEVEAACAGCDLAIDQINTTMPSCSGNDDGSITVSASCEDCAGIQYSIGNGFQPENVFDGLTAGAYTVTVQDSGNPSLCQVVETGVVVEASIADCCDLEITGTSTTMTSCPNSADGSLTVNASCTTCDGLEYSIGGDFQPESTFDNVPAGTVTVTVRDTGDPEGCTAMEIGVVIPADEDTEAPEITCPAPIVVSNDPGFCAATITALPAATATDNCATFEGAEVLVLWDRLTDEGTCSLISSLRNAGFAVTLSDVPENEWDGTNPSPSGFDAVIHLNCITWFQAMPVSGQNALVDYVYSEGGTFIGSEWTAYDIAVNIGYGSMTDLVLLDYNGFSYGERTYTTVAGQENHPLLTNVSSTFGINRSGYNVGGVKTFATNPVQTLMTSASGAAVALRELDNGGKIVNMQHSGSEGSFFGTSSVLEDNNIQQLYINGVDFHDGEVGNSAGGQITITGAPDLCSRVPVGEYLLTYTASDGNGNSDACTVTLTVEDADAPTVFCRNLTVNIGEDEMVTITTDQVLNGIVDNCTGITYSLSEDTFDCEDVGTTQMVTLTATDGGDNSGSCLAMITVNDDFGFCCDLEIINVATVDPLCPDGTDGSITVDANCTTCDGIEYSIGAGFQPGNVFTGLSAGTFTVTARDTGNDDCEEMEFNVTINDGVDTEAPVFDLACQIDQTFFTEDGNVCPADATISLSEGDEIDVFTGWTIGGISIPALQGCLSDNCTEEADLTIIVDDITITNEGTCSRTITVTFLAEDESENVSEAFVCNYTFTDNTGPEVSFNGIPNGGTYVVECDLPSTTADPLIDITELTIADNCSSIDFANITEVLTQLYDGPCVGNVLTRWQQVFTVQDGCGNETVYTLITEIIDTTPPVFTSSPANVTIECGETAPVPQLEAFDACSDVIYNFNEVRTDGDCPNNYTLTRTWLASDGCGNTSVATQIVTVEDTTPPVITFVDEYIDQYQPGDDVYIECSEYGNISQIIANNALAFDNCSGQTEVEYTLEDMGNFDCLEYGYSGHFVSTWTSKDECGNESVATINWYLVDETAPVFQGLPEDACASLDNLPPVADVQAVDDCELAVMTFSQSDPIDCDGGQYIERTWNAEDACGNSASYTQRISLNGTSGPTITIDYPEIGDVMDGDMIELPIDCDQDIAFSVADLEAAISVGAGCGSGESSIELSLMDEGDCQENGYFARYRLNVTATDACGNTTSLGIMIDFVDMTPPVVSSPNELTLNCGDDIPMIEATDACGEIASMTFVDSAPIEASCAANPVAYDRTWTVTDNCGNATTFAQSIIVLDNAGPVFSGVPADMCNNTGIDVVVTAVDGCSGNQAQVFLDEVMSSESGCGEVLTRTWTATDACGNTSTATQQVFFDDDLAPTIEFTSDLLFGLESGDELFLTVGDGFGDPGDPLFLTADDVTVTDNCASITAQVVVETTISDDCAADGYLARYDYKFIATDPCGNTSSAKLTVFYMDGNAPDFFNVPDDVEVFCAAVPEVADVIATDDYDEAVEVVFSETSTTTPEGLLITRTWKAEDSCGNTNSVSQDILVVNNDISATFSFGSDVIECNSDNNRLGVTPTGGTPPYTYQWQLTFPLEDGYITTDPTLPGILFTMGYITQTFSVLITDANGCEYLASVTVVCDFSDDEGDFAGNGNGSSVSLNVYPNPATDQIKVKAVGLAETQVKVSVYSLLGQVIYQATYEQWPVEGTLLDTRAYTEGTYVLRLETQGAEPMVQEFVVFH